MPSVPRAIPVDDRLASRRQIGLAARDLVARGAWQTCAAAVAGVRPIALVAPGSVPVILANPAGATTDFAFHALPFSWIRHRSGALIAAGAGPTATTHDCPVFVPDRLDDRTDK